MLLGDFKIMWFNIGYWYIELELYNEPEEEFIWEAKITQDGYRCWYIKSSSLIETLEKAIDFAEKYKYIIDTEI